MRNAGRVRPLKVVMRCSFVWLVGLVLCATGSSPAAAEETAAEKGLAAAIGQDDAEAALSFLEQQRGMALLASLVSREARAAAAVPARLTKAYVESRRRYRAALALRQEALKTRTRPALRIARMHIDEAEERVLHDGLALLHHARKTADSAAPRPIDLKALQTSLAAQEVYVAFALREAGSMALVVGRTKARIVKLGAAASLATISNRLREVLLEPDSATSARDLAMAAARRALVAPLGLADGTRRVLLSLDGALHAAPIEVLFPVPACRVISGSVLARLRSAGPKRGVDVLALGDPDFAHEAKGLRLPGRFPPLPATRVEARSVGDFVLVGKDATEAGLERALGKRPRWRALHLATYGTLRQDRPLLSAVALAGDENSDGLLTSLEIVRLSVPADLVVLSATDMAGGQLVAGEGLVGPARAWLSSGARAVLAPLHKVDDEATCALMKRFYALWKPKGGLSAGQALRQAQREIAKQAKWSHPYYWAGWVLMGLPNP